MVRADNSPLRHFSDGCRSSSHSISFI
jgi:hypothetical protein